MKPFAYDAFKILLCKAMLGGAALFAVLLVLAVAQGTLALLPGVLLLLVCLPVLNALCGLLAPAPRARAGAVRPVQRVHHAPARGRAA